MDSKYCTDCKWHKCYYHGDDGLMPMFTHRCWWAIKEVDKMDEADCNKDGFLQFWDEIVEHMNDEVREEVHNEFAPCSKVKFLTEYCKRDNRFTDYLWREFEIAF